LMPACAGCFVGKALRGCKFESQFFYCFGGFLHYSVALDLIGIKQL